MHMPSAPRWVKSTLLAASLLTSGCKYTSIEDSNLDPALKTEISGFRADFRTTCKATDNEELTSDAKPSLENQKLAHLHNLTDRRDNRIKKGGCKPVDVKWHCFPGTHGKGEPSINQETIHCEQ